jgi:hypothetical protein
LQNTASASVQQLLKTESGLDKIKAVMKKPKRNITAYAFFIKEVRALCQMILISLLLEETGLLQR